MNKIFKLNLALATLAILIPALGCANKGDVVPVSMSWNAPPEMQIDATKSYRAVFETSMGKFEIELWAADAPLTVNNFVFLARQGFYDGTVFHRVVREFVIQGGIGAAGDPGYTFPDELPPRQLYEAGIVAMANRGPNTNSSQFFVCTGYQSTSLNNFPNYTQFGKVISGMDVVTKIAAVVVDYNPELKEMSRPINPPKINKVTIFES